MKKKLCLMLVTCLLLSFATGCTKKTFGMPIEDLRAEINANLQTLGYDIEVPEFEIQYAEESINGGESTENKDLIFYVSYINDYCGLVISPPEDMVGSSVLLTISPHTQEEFVEMLPDMIAIASAIIMTVDPKADLQEVLDALNLTSMEVSELIKFKTDDFTYKSETRSIYENQSTYKSFIILQYPIEPQNE